MSNMSVHAVWYILNTSIQLTKNQLDDNISHNLFNEQVAQLEYTPPQSPYDRLCDQPVVITELDFGSGYNGPRQFSLHFDGVAAGLDAVLSHDGEYRIEHFRVEPELCGHGIGTELLRRAKQHATGLSDARLLTALLINPASERIARRVFGDESVQYLALDPFDRDPGGAGYNPEIVTELRYVVEHNE